MTWKDFHTIIEKQIEHLSDTRRIDFALTVCKRLFPEYKYFQEQHNWGDSLLLAEGINFIEHYNHNNELNKPELENLIVQLDAIIPDMDDFGDWDGSYALNASLSVLETLEFLVDKNPVHIISVSTLMMDTIDFKIAESDEDIPDEEVWKHPLMIQEMKWQIETTK